jgi:hypothetical protein
VRPSAPADADYYGVARFQVGTTERTTEEALAMGMELKPEVSLKTARVPDGSVK